MYHSQPVYNETMAAQTFSSRNNQNLFDVCTQTYGDLNKMYKLIQDSGFESLMKVPVVGTEFIFDNSLISNYPFYNQLNGSGQIINTNSHTDEIVFGTEDLQTIFISEDGTKEFTPES